MALFFKIVPQNNKGLVEVLGKYRKSVDPGIHYIPFSRNKENHLGNEPFEVAELFSHNEG